MQGIILLMDNMKDALAKWGSLLEDEGYHVIMVSTLEEAENVMRDGWVHLALLDIRMVDEDDPNDISGLDLAQKPEFLSIVKIVLTSYPSYQYARSSLAPQKDGQRFAVNFISKSEGPQALLEAVKHVFKDHIHINWNLVCQGFQNAPLPFLYLTSLIQSGLSNDLMLLRAGELEDLFRSLFYAYQQVRIGRLLWQDNGRFCIPVMACSPQGATSSMVLTCGERSLMKQEWKNLEELIPHSILGITPSDTSETTHFGASIYELPEADFDTLQTFRELFHAGKERSIKTVLTHLLDDVLNTWHQHGQSVLEKLDLMSYYRQKMGLSETEISRDEVERRVEMLINAVRTLGTIEIKRNSDSITFVLSHQNDQSFPDPIVAVYGSLTEFDTSVVCKISPGKLNPDNVLVDGGSRVWPSDFVSIGQAPQWWDFICLEAAIRFDLSHAPDLLAWDGFEKCLSNSDRLDSRIEPKDIVPELNISIGLIEQIRRRAASETGFNPLPYQAGLLAWVVKAMTNYTPGSLLTQADKLRGAHLLLAAAMISESLTKISPSPLPAGGALRLDKENRVWIGDRMVTTLSGSRLKLLNCLYEQSGKAVNNRIITETVYDEKYDPLKDGQNQRIRQEIRRLREEIEPDPDRPRYILTVRENGYRLQPKGESEE